MNQKKCWSYGPLNIPSEASSPLLPTLVTLPYLQTSSLSASPSICCTYTYSSYFYGPLDNSKCPKKQDWNRFFNHLQHRAFLLDKSHLLGCRAVVHPAMQLLIKESFIVEQVGGYKHIFMSTFIKLRVW